MDFAFLVFFWSVAVYRLSFVGDRYTPRIGVSGFFSCLLPFAIDVYFRFGPFSALGLVAVFSGGVIGAVGMCFWVKEVFFNKTQSVESASSGDVPLLSREQLRAIRLASTQK